MSPQHASPHTVHISAFAVYQVSETSDL